MKLLIFLACLLSFSALAQVGTGPAVRQTNSLAVNLTQINPTNTGKTTFPGGSEVSAAGVFTIIGPSTYQNLTGTNLYAANLNWATTINVTNFGVVPYIPNNFAAGTFPTNAVDNSVQLSNVFRFASNQIAPVMVYFPPGIYKFTNTLTIPPLVSVRGEGWLHDGGSGVQRIQSTPGTVSTNNFSLLWWAGSTNGTAIRAPYNAYGPQYFGFFEICGATNPMADLGNAVTANTISTLGDTNRGFCGINFDCNVFCGGYIMQKVSVCGFKVGVNHAGNRVLYDFCSFNGNNIGFVQTNNWAADQVTIRHCSIGSRSGGVGYYITQARGWLIEQPCDIDYYAFLMMLNAQIKVTGGNSEANSTVAPSWAFFQDTMSSYYISNSWPYAKKTPFILAKQNTLVRNTLTIVNGQYSGVSRDGLIASYRPVNSQNQIFVQGTIWDTTNTISAGQSVVVPMLLMTEAFQEDAPAYIGSSLFPVAMVEEYTSMSIAPKYTYTVSQRSSVPSSEVQLNFANIFNGGPATSSTNLNQYRFGQWEHQFGTTTTPDWLQIQVASNWTSAGRPNISRYRIPLSDPGPLPADGLPNTNFTFERVLLRNLAVRGTNAAPAVTTTATWIVITNVADGKAYAVPAANYP